MGTSPAAGPLALATLAAALTCGCTHWVVIRSTPPGATARIDGVEVGRTPLFFEESTGWSKVYRLELEKEGYEPLAAKLSQDDLQWRYACPSVCLCPPTLGLSLTGCLFSYGLPDEMRFVLVPLDGGRSSEAFGGEGGRRGDGGVREPRSEDADRNRKDEDSAEPPQSIPF